MFSQNLDVFMFFSTKRNIMEKQTKHKKYFIKFQIEVVEYAKEHSVNTADKSGVHRKSVQEWRKQANARRQVTKNHASTFRIEGGGRKMKLDAVELDAVELDAVEL